MDEHDLLLIVDNDRRHLAVYLSAARESDWDAEFAQVLTEKAIGVAVRDVAAGHLVRDIALQALSRVDWEFVAEHYRVKVSEGASVPEVGHGAS